MRNFTKVAMGLIAGLLAINFSFAGGSNQAGTPKPTGSPYDPNYFKTLFYKFCGHANSADQKKAIDAACQAVIPQVIPGGVSSIGYIKIYQPSTGSPNHPQIKDCSKVTDNGYPKYQYVMLFGSDQDVITILRANCS